MVAKRFQSKVDWWLIIILVVSVAVIIVAMLDFARSETDPIAVTGFVLVTLLVVALIVSVTLTTHYTVDRNTLIVRSGPFRWKIPIDQITSVESTRNPLSSPALSLDRLRIRYGKNRRIMISPADKSGFLKAIGQELKE